VLRALPTSSLERAEASKKDTNDTLDPSGHVSAQLITGYRPYQAADKFSLTWAYWRHLYHVLAFVDELFEQTGSVEHSRRTVGLLAYKDLAHESHYEARASLDDSGYALIQDEHGDDHNVDSIAAMPTSRAPPNRHTGGLHLFSQNGARMKETALQHAYVLNGHNHHMVKVNGPSDRMVFWDNLGTKSSRMMCQQGAYLMYNKDNKREEKIKDLRTKFQELRQSILAERRAQTVSPTMEELLGKFRSAREAAQAALQERIRVAAAVAAEAAEAKRAAAAVRGSHPLATYGGSLRNKPPSG